MFNVTELPSVVRTQPALIPVPDPAAAALQRRRSCLETQQDELLSLPIPAKPAPGAHHRSGTPHFKVIHRAGPVWLGLEALGSTVPGQF